MQEILLNVKIIFFIVFEFSKSTIPISQNKKNKKNLKSDTLFCIRNKNFYMDFWKCFKQIIKMNNGSFPTNVIDYVVPFNTL